MAFCEICRKTINCKSSGKNAFCVHAEDTKHTIIQSNQALMEKSHHDFRLRKIIPVSKACSSLTPAERAQRYRESIIKNPTKHKEFLEKERERKKLSWRKRKEEQINKDRIKGRERQQRFRDRKKLLGVTETVNNEKKKKKLLTRSAKEKQREYWRGKKAESRLRRTGQKIRRVKEKDKLYKQEKRNAMPVKRTRMKGCLPKDPQEFANALEEIIDKATPRKKECLTQKKIINTPTSRKKLHFFDKSSNIMKHIVKTNRLVKSSIIRKLSFLKKYRLNRTLSTYLGVNDSVVSKVGAEEPIKQTRKDATSAKDKTSIQDFFLRADTSTNLPAAKRVKKDMEERRVLDRPLIDVYRDFKECHKDIKASFSTFIRNKPTNVESTRKQPWFGCLCECCTNVELKLKALSQISAKKGSNVKVRDKYEAVQLSLCDKDENTRYHKLACIQRRCTTCGVDKAVQYFQPLAEEASMETVVYSKWERVKKMYKGKEITQIMPISHRGSLTQLILNLSQELEKLAEHLFVAAWQHNQFTTLQKNVPQSWVVLNMDFAENYSCVAQQEV